MGAGILAVSRVGFESSGDSVTRSTNGVPPSGGAGPHRCTILLTMPGHRSEGPQIYATPALGGLYTAILRRWPECIAVSVYAGIVAFAIPYHEAWADEAQSWQLARSLSLGDLFQSHIRYEASPGLWHFLLWVLIHAHVTYAGLHWISGVIAVVAASLFVFCSPFPRYLKLTLPFTYFLLFQYAVVARSYVLVPLFLFAIAYWWKQNPLAVSVMMGLLANVSLHAAAISGGLAILYVLEQIRLREYNSPHSRRKLLWCAVIVLSFYVFALWTAWPSHEVMVSNASRVAIVHSIPFAVKALASLVSVCSPWFLSIAVWIAIVVCLYARHSLRFFLPVISFAAFSGVAFAQFWHQGLIVPTILCLLWITWPPPGASVTREEAIGRAGLALMVIVQILWSGYALRFDHYRAYSPDIAAAKFLKPFVQRGSTIGVTYFNDWDQQSMSSLNQAYFDVGILPYFDHNIYANQPDSFWWWSDKNPTESLFNSLLPFHPQIVIAEVDNRGPPQPLNLNTPKVEALQQAGYRLTNVFCGSIPGRLELTHTNCHLIFQYSGTP
jgi:hypothetical protein